MNPKTVANNVDALYSFPEVTLKLSQIISTEEYSNAEVVTFILCDPALTAQILRLANSPDFGFSQQIENVTDAVSVIGKPKLHDLITSANTAAPSGFIPTISMTESFWFRSIACGIVTHMLAAKTQKKEIERLYITGLLHAIGKLVFFVQFPKESNEIPSNNSIGEDATIAAKQELFGFTHTELGAELLKQWQLPASIWEPILFQLNPPSSSTPINDSSLLQVALNITNSMAHHLGQTNDHHEIIPACQTEAWNQLGLNEKVIDLIKAETSLQILDILSELKPEILTIY